LWLHSLKVTQLPHSAPCLHTNQSRSYLNHLVYAKLHSVQSRRPLPFKTSNPNLYFFTLYFEQMFRCCRRLRRRRCSSSSCCCCSCLVVGFYVSFQFYNVTTFHGLKKNIGRSRSKGLRRTYLMNSASVISNFCVWCSVNCGI